MQRGYTPGRSCGAEQRLRRGEVEASATAGSLSLLRPEVGGHSSTTAAPPPYGVVLVLAEAPRGECVDVGILHLHLRIKQSRRGEEGGAEPQPPNPYHCLPPPLLAACPELTPDGASESLSDDSPKASRSAARQLELPPA